MGHRLGGCVHAGNHQLIAGLLDARQQLGDGLFVEGDRLSPVPVDQGVTWDSDRLNAPPDHR